MANTATSPIYPTIPIDVMLSAVDNRLIQVLKDRDNATPEPESDDEDMKNYRPPYSLFCRQHRRYLSRETLDNMRQKITSRDYWKTEAQQYLTVLAQNTREDTRPGSTATCPWKGIVHFLLASLRLLGYDTAEIGELRYLINDYGYWEAEMAAIELENLRKEYDGSQSALLSLLPRLYENQQDISPETPSHPLATFGYKRKRGEEEHNDYQPRVTDTQGQAG